MTPRIMNDASHQNRHWIVQWLVAAVGFVFVAWTILSILRVGTVFWFYSDIATWVGTNLNVDDHVATLLAVLITALALPLLPFVTSFIFFGRYRREVTGIAIGSALAIFGLLSYLGDDVFFDQRTGKPIRYYADTVSGIKFYRSPGFDKKFGVPRIPVTQETIRSLEREKLGIKPKRIDLVSSPELELFSTVDGKPKVWFYRRPNGSIELFDGPGFHPQIREPLMPITTEIASVIEAAQLRQREMGIAKARSTEEEAITKRQHEQQEAEEANRLTRAKLDAERIEQQRRIDSEMEARKKSEWSSQPNLPLPVMAIHLYSSR